MNTSHKKLHYYFATSKPKRATVIITFFLLTALLSISVFATGTTGSSDGTSWMDTFTVTPYVGVYDGLPHLPSWTDIPSNVTITWYTDSARTHVTTGLVEATTEAVTLYYKLTIPDQVGILGSSTVTLEGGNAILTRSDGIVHGYTSPEAALMAASTGDSIAILEDWNVEFSTLIPYGVTVTVSADKKVQTVGIDTEVKVNGNLVILGTWNGPLTIGTSGFCRVKEGAVLTSKLTNEGSLVVENGASFTPVGNQVSGLWGVLTSSVVLASNSSCQTIINGVSLNLNNSTVVPTNYTENGHRATIFLTNELGDSQSILLSLRQGNTILTSVPISLSNGSSFSLTVNGLHDGFYSLLVTSGDNQEGILSDIVCIKGEDILLSLPLSKIGPVLGLNVEANSNVTAVKLPSSLLQEITLDDRGLTQADWQSETPVSLEASINIYTAEDAPFHETLQRAADDKTIGQFLQVQIVKKRDETSTYLTRTNDLITIIMTIPEDILEDAGDNIYDMVLYRVLDGNTSSITSTPNVYGEYYDLEDDVLTLYVCGCTTYALAYQSGIEIIPLWWALLLLDLLGFILLLVDKYFKPIDYYLRVSAGMVLAAAIVMVLTVRSHIAELIFAGITWVLMMFLMFRKRQKHLHATDTSGAEDEASSQQ